jgi:hypothetical protein
VNCANEDLSKEDRMNFRTPALAAIMLITAAASAFGQATIQYPSGKTFLYVNNEGHLNGSVSNLDPSYVNPLPVISNPSQLGLFYDGVGDATVDGCECEGWGASAVFDTSGFTSAGASVDNGGVTGLASTGLFGATASTATSQVTTLNGLLSVTHQYGPSIVFDVFQAQVTLTNNSDTEIAHDVVYRRIMDWDVSPTPFDEFVTIQGVESNLEANGGNVRRAVDNGFDSSDPGFGGLSTINEPANTDFVDSGPNDHGAGFDFAFGDIAPGESRTFNIFYGAAPNQAAAEAAINTLGADVWSFGQSNVLGLPFDGGPCGSDTPPDGCGFGGEIGATAAGGAETPTPTAVPGEANPVGEPATFLFAFGGVGGVEPGASPETPLLPFAPAEGTTTFVFEEPTSGLWFDPPFVDAYFYTLLGDPTAFFTSVEVPPVSFGFGDIMLLIDSIEVATLSPGDSFDFVGAGYTDVQEFVLASISPLIELADAAFAFPVKLSFDGTPLALTIEALTTSGPGPTTTPEPATAALLGVSLIGLLVVRRRRA